MLIQVDKLKRRPRRIDIDAPAEDFKVLQELIDQDTVNFTSAIIGHLVASWAGDIIEVSGHLSTHVSLPCGRCLRPVSRSLDCEILLCYSDSERHDQLPSEDDVELQEDELGIITYSGTEIDLRSDIEQEIVMALPRKLLCDEGCQGLCPQCGTNRNEGDCDCEPPVFHAGLAALKEFKLNR